MNNIDTENLEYVISKIQNAEIKKYPWPHIIINNFLPATLYTDIVKELDDSFNNKVLKKKNIRAYRIMANFSVGLFPQNSQALSEYYNILNEVDVWDSLKKKLNLDIDAKDFYSELNLFTSGYAYDEVHPDREDKLVTMLHYLADEGDDESIGTFLYTPKRDGNKLDIVNDRLASAPYIRNAVLFFAPNNSENFKTNHCMANHSKKTFLRKSFQSFWIRDPADWTKDPQSGRIKI